MAAGVLCLAASIMVIMIDRPAAAPRPRLGHAAPRRRRHHGLQRGSHAADLGAALRPPGRRRPLLRRRPRLDQMPRAPTGRRTCCACRALPTMTAPGRLHLDLTAGLLALLRLGDPHRRRRAGPGRSPRHPNLPAFCATASPDASPPSAWTSSMSRARAEARSNAGPVGGQRGWVRFTSAMCKPVLTRTPVAWAPGFHSSDQPLALRDAVPVPPALGRPHLGLERLRKTRAMPWADGRSARTSGCRTTNGAPCSTAWRALPTIAGRVLRAGAADPDLARPHARQRGRARRPCLRHRPARQRRRALADPAALPRPPLTG